MAMNAGGCLVLLCWMDVLLRYDSGCKRLKCHTICIITVHTPQGNYHRRVCTAMSRFVSNHSIGSVWSMFFLVHDPCPEFLAIHIQCRRCCRLSVRRCHIGLRPAIDIFFWLEKRWAMCPFPVRRKRNTTIAARSKLPPGILFRNRARLLTYPLGVPLFAPRACLRRVRSLKQVPNRHCALFTLICLKACGFWQVNGPQKVVCFPRIVTYHQGVPRV